MKMRSILLLCMLLAANFAYAEAESGSTSSIGQASSSSGQFHWLTRKCNIDENDEIETTPGSPPLSVDDPATPGCNKWEINIVANGDLSGSDKTWELPLLDINYGIGDNLQLKYEVPNVVTQNQDSHSSAIGNSKTGIKYQFYGNDETKLQFAIYPQMEFSRSGKDSDADAPATHGTVTTVPLLMAKRIGSTARGDIMLSANFGYNINSRPDAANSVSASVGIGAPLVKKISVLAEIATDQAIRHLANEPRSQIVQLDLGLMSPIGKHFAVFGAVGRSLIASDEKNHTYLTSGFRFLLGN
jgi:hypothetical protein